MATAVLRVGETVADQQDTRVDRADERIQPVGPLPVRQNRFSVVTSMIAIALLSPDGYAAKRRDK